MGHVLSRFCLQARHNNICCVDVRQIRLPSHAPAPSPEKPGNHNIRHILYSIKYYTFHFCASIVNFSEQEFCFGYFSPLNESPVPYSCIPAGKDHAPKSQGKESKKRASLAPILILFQGSAGWLGWGAAGGLKIRSCFFDKAML